MGQAITAIRNTLTAPDEEKKKEMEERLHVLESMVEQRLENQHNKILNGEKNDQEIDTGTIVSLHKMVYIKLKSGESDDMQTAINQLFSGKLIGGLESIIRLGAETVLGNDCMGEYETTDMFIVWTDNALLRCDAYYYCWNFASESVIEQAEGVTGILLMQRVIDLTKTDPQVLTWAITRMADRLNNTDPKPEKPVNPTDIIDEALEVLEKVIEFQAKIKASEAGALPELHA